MESSAELKRSDSLKEGTFVHQNEKYGNKLLESFSNAWESKEFHDVILIVGIQEMSIKAHKIILVALSEYLKGLLMTELIEGKQENIRCLETLHGPAVCKLIEYGYKGFLSVHLEREDIRIEQLLEAADYMQMQDVCASIASFLQQNIAIDNCLGIYQCALIYNLKQVQIKALKFACMNYSDVSKSDEFLSIPLQILTTLIKDDRLIVHKDHVVLPQEERESLVVQTVFNYVESNLTERKTKLPELLQILKLPLLLNNQLTEFRTHELIKGDSECLAVFEQAKISKKSAVATNDEGYSWAEPRRNVNFILREPCIYACGGEISREINKFSCREALEKNPRIYVAGLTLGFRRWDGRLVLGGIGVNYSNGNKPFYGCDQTHCEEIHSIELLSNERIVKIEIHSGWMIDNLTFHTNLGRRYGPWGGDGGSCYTETVPCNGHFGYLAGISGTVVNSQHKPGITRLGFMWGLYTLCDETSKEIKNLNMDVLIDPLQLLMCSYGHIGNVTSLHATSDVTTANLSHETRETRINKGDMLLPIKCDVPNVYYHFRHGKFFDIPNYYIWDLKNEEIEEDETSDESCDYERLESGDD